MAANEEQEKENVKEEKGEVETKGETEKDSNNGDADNKEEEKTGLSSIEQAEKLAKRIEEGNKKTEELQKRQEELIAKQILGGKSEGGTGEAKEETPAEYKNRVMRNEI